MNAAYFEHEHRFNPMSNQLYNDGHGNSYDVEVLYDFAKVNNLPVESAPVTALNWAKRTVADSDTIQDVFMSIVQARKADMSYPILLGPTGTIFDGAHRVLKALMYPEEYPEIQYIRLPRIPSNAVYKKIKKAQARTEGTTH